MKLTAPQLRLLRLMRDGWTLIDIDDQCNRLISPEGKSEKTNRQTTLELWGHKLVEQLDSGIEDGHEFWRYKLTALGRDAAGDGT